MLEGRQLFSSESVTEGHPDKVADRISDSVLDFILTADLGTPAEGRSRVACETLVTTGLVVVAGEITTDANPDFREIAREAIRDIGYTDPAYRFDADSCGIVVTVDRQSPDINQGVDRGEGEEQGAGDQGMMFGYATDETEQLMPLPITLAHRLTGRLAEVRKSGAIPWLRPDGKSQVTVQYDGDRPVSIPTVVVSTQHDPGVGNDEIRARVIEEVIEPTLPAELFDPSSATLHINPTGAFVTGGPHGDTGLTGRKIIVDTYGGFASHGGGAFSGKDATKVDRSGTYAARWIAKNIVAAGLARRATVQLAYAIGVAEPVSVMVDTDGTADAPDESLAAAVRQVFDLRPAAVIERLGLQRPIFARTAAYGHLGREPQDDGGFSWERTDRTTDLIDALG